MQYKDIKTLTIVPCDDVAHINGEPHEIDGKLFPDNIHAIQWLPRWKHVEYNDGTPQKALDSLECFRSPIEAMLAAAPTNLNQPAIANPNKGQTMAYVKEDAYLALKSELDSFKSEVKELKGFKSELEELKATVARATGRSDGNLFGPKNDPGIDLSGHIGEIRATVPPLGSDADTIKNWAQHIPVNWVICDGRTVKRPDGSSYEAPNYLGRLLVHWPPEASASTLGLKSGSWDYTFSGKSGDPDRNHTHGVEVVGHSGPPVLGTTQGATLSVGNLASPRHKVGVDDHQDAGATKHQPDVNPGNFWHFHNIAIPLRTHGIDQVHAHNVTLSGAHNRPPHICVWYIQRFF